MTKKISRNEPCHCGSGKKYKQCHGQRVSPSGTESRAHQPATTVSTTIAHMGLSGQQQHLIVVNQYADAADPRNVGGPQGVPGKYVVAFVLSRPGFNILPEANHSFAAGLRGDSHLAISKPAFSPPGNPDADRIKIAGLTDDGSFAFYGYPNERGFLGKLESEPFDANGFDDAELKAYRALASSLSNWSAHLDIPLHIFQVESTELRTLNKQTGIVTPHQEVPLAIMPTATLQAEFRGYVSLYREALSSNSPVYQFLCLFKMVEGMLRRRGRLGAEARKRGTTITREHEQIPRDIKDTIPWLNAIFPIRPIWDAMALSSIFPPEALGKSLKFLIDKYLYPLRIDVAHAISSQTGELTQSIDELLHARNVNKWLPVTKCIVRRTLKNEFPQDFLPYLKEDGTITT